MAKSLVRPRDNVRSWVCLIWFNHFDSTIVGVSALLCLLGIGCVIVIFTASEYDKESEVVY